MQNPRGGKVRRAATFTNLRAGPTVEALTDREGKQANTIAKQKEMLRAESFPLNDGDQYHQLPPAGHAHQNMTEHSVERALILQSVKNSPGSGKLPFGAISLLSRWDNTSIQGLTKAAVRMGLHPAIWKRMRGQVISKPRTEDYTKLKLYITISLLSCMGTVVQKVVTELLSDESER